MKDNQSESANVLELFTWYDYSNLKNWLTTVVESDLKSANGFIHAIDFVMIPPFDAYTMLYHIPMCFSTFISAAQLCGLETELKQDQSITVFAPSNAAWYTKLISGNK